MNTKNFENRINDLILFAYQDSLKFHFKYHPRGKHIVNALLRGQVTSQEAVEVFLENERIISKKLGLP